MAAFASFSTTAASNTSVGGVSIDEGCAAGNVNDAIRYILKEGRELYDLVAAFDSSTLMPKAGGAFTGDITRSGAGGYLYNTSGAGGKVYIQTTSASLPSSPAEGTFVFQY